MVLVLGIAPRVALAQGLKFPPSWWLLGNWDAEFPAAGVLPSRFVWTELFPGKEARSQGSCGSCWAFGAVGALEYQVMIYDRRDVDLSEQWLINCNQDGQSCDGGYAAYPYLMPGGYTDNCGGNGAVLESDLPYTGTGGVCNCPFTHHYWLQGWRFIGVPPQLQGSRDQIKRAIYLFGPISSSVNMRPWPQSGRFTEVLNTCTGDQVNHVVLIVGWNDAIGAWRIRNSWGPDWGDNGEAWVTYECNVIGFAANYVTYPTGRGVYVDFNYTGLAGNETGLFNQPFNTLDEGVSALDAGGTLSVKTGSNSATPTWTKPMKVLAFGGPVTIGR